MKLLAIARVVHEANRAVQIEQADPSIPITAHWDEIGHEMQDSAFQGVVGVVNGNTPEQSHASWVRFKETHGWVLGPVKSEALRQHPLLVPYDALPPDAKVKDALFVAIVNALKETE